jgi:hexokinase
MAVNIASRLDHAKAIHRLPSDYKLALVMGVKPTTLANYRTGKTLPDARVIRLLCDLTGDDAALLAAEIEEQRATTEDARAIWHQVAVRLQQAAAAGVVSVVAVVSGTGVATAPAPAQAQTTGGLYIM